MPREDLRYNSGFYDALSGPAAESAGVVVPLLMEWLDPQSVLDVGCGLGDWLACWVEHGVLDVVGIDGDYVDEQQLHISSERFRAADVTRPLDLGRSFDLVSCLEVAEHLDDVHAPTLVDTLTRHADVILFSAAVPGQAGTHHVNCQWPSHWAAQFRSRGFRCYDVLRPRLWLENRLAPWYRQNLLIFVRDQHASCDRLDELAGACRPPLDLVHPSLSQAELPGSLSQHLKELGPLASAAIRRRVIRTRA